MAIDNSNGMDGATSAFESDLGGDVGLRETVFPNLNKADTDEEDGTGNENEQDGDESGVDDEFDDEGADEKDSDASDDEDSDASDDEDADEEGKDGDAEGVDLSAVVRLKVDGEEVEVPLSEALRGYVRTETFHKRLNMLNEAKTVIERERGEVSVSRAKYMEGLATLTQQLDQLTPAEPDWDALYAADPANAREMEKKWHAFKEQRAALDGEKQRVTQEQAAEQKRNLYNYVGSEQVKLLNAVPEWNDPKIRERESSSMRKTALAHGFSEQEVNEIYDHRVALVLRKAAAYDRIMAKKPVPTKVVTNRPATPGSGSPNGKTVQKGGDRAMQKLSRTGSLQDATNVFAKFI